MTNPSGERFEWQPTMNLRVRTSWVEPNYLEQEWQRTCEDASGEYVETEWRRVPIFPE